MVTEAWRPVALPDGIIDKRGWTLCVLDRLRAALRHRDVWTTVGRRWGDPRPC